MLRVFFALNILFLPLLACKGGYETCIKKVKDSNSLENQIVQIPISKNKKLIYSKQKPDAHILKHDRFLNLYLIKEKTNFKHPFRTNYNIPLGYASVDNKKAIEGVVKKNQIGLNSFATFSEPLTTPALLLNSCCALEGIVTADGIIQKEYINNFIKKPKVDYGDIGVRVEDKNSKVVVNRVDPFDKSVRFKKGDLILELNSKKVESSAEFMQDILFGGVGKTHTVKIKRQNKEISIKCVSKQRYGGGYIGDTFLESKGLYLDEELKIVNLSRYFKRYGLKVGDQLIQVNGKKVNTKSDISKNIEDFKHKASLLFSRDNFQFFININ